MIDFTELENGGHEFTGTVTLKEGRQVECVVRSKVTGPIFEEVVWEDFDTDDNGINDSEVAEAKELFKEAMREAFQDTQCLAV